MDKPQRWDRFGYVLNNPMRYTDPFGHKEAGECGPGDICNISQGSGNSNSSMSSNDTDNGGCGGQGCNLGGNNDDNTSEDGSTEIQLPNGNPTLQDGDTEAGFTLTQKIGKASTLFVVLIVCGLVEGTIIAVELVVVPASGPTGGPIIATLATAATITVADFEVSYALKTYSEVVLNKPTEFKWTLIPTLFSIFQKP